MESDRMGWYRMGWVGWGGVGVELVCGWCGVELGWGGGGVGWETSPDKVPAASCAPQFSSSAPPSAEPPATFGGVAFSLVFWGEGAASTEGSAGSVNLLSKSIDGSGLPTRRPPRPSSPTSRSVLSSLCVGWHVLPRTCGPDARSNARYDARSGGDHHPIGATAHTVRRAR